MITIRYTGPGDVRVAPRTRYFNLYWGEITDQVHAAVLEEMKMAATKKTKKKAAPKTKVKTGSGTLKFGSPEWQAKYGKGKKKAKK